ncbi:LOW QUALITY PROTEIN: hypothetical protein PHMEG_00027621 [Phytophthora megakarya]|uniref:Reverse transcriptase domain-containing protein n=1 Tax=Phytophthora megakarya TaxID=4795 RepID=A0A225V7G6_9STRA|nr:LOW QUALITY PROTEIN: hypothetical protein PHMEG_00027621 [Phytophthora megakarya]
MAADSIEKTAFTCKYGLFEWLVMPFGLCNAVPASERLMVNVLVDLKWRTCLVYLDECVVFSSDFPTHLVRLKQVLNGRLQVKTKEVQVGPRSSRVLVTPSSILPNPEKVKAVINYIPGYAGISAPIERLKLKGAAFTDDYEAVFLQLKRCLVEPPILVYPDFSERVNDARRVNA